MKMMKKMLALLFALVMVLGLVSCASGGDDGQNNSDGGNDGNTGANDAGDTGGTSDGEPIKIGVAACHYTNSWNITNTENLVETFENAGYEVVWNEAKNDTATQVANVNDLIAQGIDYLIMKPKEEEGLVPAIEACKEAGVKVILVDPTVNATPGEDYVCSIRTNATLGGERCAEWVVENFPDGCNIIEITGTAGSTTSIERSEGFMSVLEEAGDQYVVLESQTANFMRTDAQTVTENLYQAYGDQIDVIVSQSDEMTFGVLQAIDGLGLTPGEDITVVSIGDGASLMLDEIIAGRVACCSECTPFLAEQCLEVVETLESGGTVDTNIWANDRFFTIENAAEEQAIATW